MYLHSSVTIDEAHSWLREGYFTSEMLFLFAPEGADIKSGAFRVWTLSEFRDETAIKINKLHKRFILLQKS